MSIVQSGNPVLRKKAALVEEAQFGSPELLELVDRMVDEMRRAPGVGLAAPQIGQSLRLVVMRLIADRSAADEPLRMMALINPELEPISDEIELGWEGCLSVPELRGVVPRYKHIGYRGWLPDGIRVEGEFSGFQARILQHEVDHLDGIIYLDRMRDLSTLGYGPEIQAAAEAAPENATL
jgi:peptide deformylase